MKMFQMLGESVSNEFARVIRKRLLTIHLFPELLRIKWDCPPVLGSAVDFRRWVSLWLKPPRDDSCHRTVGFRSFEMTRI